ncbi:competence protein ComGC, partial [Lacticaseibacillus rhamnosus]
MKRKKLRAFTLIEVVAALGVIILLTLALVLTIQGQMKRVDTQNLKATVATVNTQLEMTYNEPDHVGVDFSSPDQLVKKDVISQSQADTLKKG